MSPVREQMPRLLIYDDNPEYGGHQVMAAHALEALAAEETLDLHFWHHPGNRKWIRRLEALPPGLKVSTGHTPTVTRKLQVIRNYWERSPEVKNRIASLQPDMVLVIQGDIEHSSLAVLELARMGVDTVSYIPMVHRYGVMQARLAWVRDLCAGRVFKKIGKWITISESIAADLRQRSPRAQVRVVENGIPLEHFSNPHPEVRREVRKELGLPEEDRVCAMIGRVELNQKQQNVAVEAFSRFQESFKGWQLLIVGSGPDDARLDEQIQQSAAADRIYRIPWMDHPERVYAAIDCLLLPSGYEGVPLVMLEALAAGIPVIASDRDGMRDLLPEGWRFPQGSCNALAETFAKAVSGGFPGLAECVTRVRTNNSLAAFKSSFVKAIYGFMEGP